MPFNDDAHGRERIIRRLEAFSDIVIGFSLAQLGLSLVIPLHAIDFVQRPVSIFAFLVTFVIVVRFWWIHFQIIEYYFEPNRLMIACNFVALASLILQIFTLQLYLHFVPLTEGLVASRIYFGFFVLSYGMLCAMLALGLYFRWTGLAIRHRRIGVQAAVQLFGTVAGCALGNVFSTHEPANVYVSVKGQQELVATIPSSILPYTLVGFIVGLAMARLVPRVFRHLQRS